MNPSYTCPPCRRKISRLGLGMGTRIHGVKVKRRTFISLNNPPQRTTTNTQDVPLNLPSNSEAANGSESLPAVYSRPPPERQRQRAPQRSKNPGDQLEALFEAARTPPASALKPVLQYYEHAATLKSMLLDQNVPAAEVWRFFIQHFPQDDMEAASVDGTISPAFAFLRDSAYGGKLLLKRLNQAYLQETSSAGSDTKLPTLTEVTRVFTQLGILRGRDWTDSIFAVLAKMFKREEALRRGVEYEAVLADLVECWKVVHRGPRQKGQVDATENDWARSVYNAKAQNPSLRKSSHGTVGFFSRALTPTFSLTQALDVPLVALATFFLLTEHAIGQNATQHESFTNALGHLISAASLQKSYLKDSASKNHSTLKAGANANFIRETLDKNWIEIMERVSPNRPLQRENSLRQKIVRATPDEAIKEVSDVEIRKDIVQLEKLWFKHQPSTGGLVLSDAESRNLAKLYNNFIRAFMSLRRPNRAIDVWNHMISNGVLPGILSWTALLEGCKVSRDWEAMQDVWSKMEALNVKPDNTCWSIRMFCLIECNKFELAILALDQMGRSWLMAAREIHGAKKTVTDLVDVSDIEGTPKPGIRTVNASIDGFLKKGKSQEAHRILAWAGKFGVHPDVETYNILLGSLIRDDQTMEAMALLQHMHKSGIAANSTTFTVILSETFKRSKHYTADEQNQIVDNIFTEMEGAGLKATIHTYGKIIHEMLHVGSGDHGSANIRAVNAVMERMGREKVRPGAFIYTDFINYYFNCKPPDLDGVRSVIERYKSDDDNTNSVFWDLVVKNYAKVGDTASAMRILGQVRDNPALDHPKWATYYVLLTALAENEEWDTARTLVKTLVLETGGPDDDPDPKHWHKRDFWTRARELKFMES